MQDSILQNGFGESPAPPSTAQVDQVSGFTLSLADKIASQVNANKFSTDFKIAALQGIGSVDHINNLNAKAQELGQVNAKIDADIAATKASIAGLKPQEANDANYVSAISAYENLLKQSPNAPVLQKMNLTDTDKLMMGFALLSGVNPNDAIGNFIKVKQGFVDQANNQAVDQFKIDTGVFNQQLGGLENMIGYQGQQLNREQSRLNKEYETQYNGFADQLSELYKRADTRGKSIIQHIGSLSDDFRQTWEKGSRAWSADDEKAAQGWLTQQANFLGVDPAQLIASVPRPQIGDIPQKVVDQNADNALALKRFDFDTRKWAQQSEFNRMSLRERTRQFNEKMKLQREFLAKNYDLKVSDFEWTKYVDSKKLELQTLGYQLDVKELENKGTGVKTDKQYRTDYANLDQDIARKQGELRSLTDAEDIQKKATEIAGLIAEQAQIANLIEWTDEEIAGTKPAQDAIAGGLSQFGIVSPINPGKPKTAPQSPPALSGNIGKGLPNPTNPPKANTGGGKSKTTQKTGKDKTPAKSPQNAGNGQPPKGVVVTKSKTKFFDKKPTK